MKPTTIENKVFILSFGSSQFVSFVDSRNWSQDENVAPIGSQKNQQKKYFSQTRNVQKTTSMAENTRKVCKKLKEGSKRSTIVGKSVRNTQLLRMYFKYKQTDGKKANIKLTQLCANAVRCCIQFWKMFQPASPHVHHNEDQNVLKESKSAAAKTSNVKKTKTISRKRGKKA